MRTLGEQDVWQCPRCGRGSSDPRDEAAHLDAHRRLERDRSLVTWEVLAHRLAHPEPGSRDRNGRRGRGPLVLAVLAAMLLGSLLLGVRPGEVLPGRPDEPRAPAPTTPPDTSITPILSPRPSPVASLPGRPPDSPPPVPVETGAPPSSPPPVSQPLTAGPAPPTMIPAKPAADSPHLVKVCIPSLCVAL